MLKSVLVFELKNPEEDYFKTLAGMENDSISKIEEVHRQRKGVTRNAGKLVALAASISIIKGGFELASGDEGEALAWGVIGGLIVGGGLFLIDRFRKWAGERRKEDGRLGRTGGLR